MQVRTLNSLLQCQAQRVYVKFVIVVLGPGVGRPHLLICRLPEFYHTMFTISFISLSKNVVFFFLNLNLQAYCPIEAFTLYISKLKSLAWHQIFLSCESCKVKQIPGIHCLGKLRCLYLTSTWNSTSKWNSWFSLTVTISSPSN